MDIDWELTGKVIWCLGLVAWTIIRWVPNRHARRMKIGKTTRTPSERFSMVASATGLGVVPAIWVFTGFPGQFDYTANPAMIVIGVVLLAITMRLFRVTHKALGKMWSHSLDLRENHKLVTKGIYAKLRHPMYSAFWLWAVAQVFLLSNWVAGIAGLIGFGTLYFLRVGQEEAMMHGQFGDEYADYSKRTKRIIPGIY